MIQVNLLRGVFAREGKTQREVAEAIGITQKTLREKLRRGVFGSDEIEAMIQFLNIDNPMEIFFANKVT